MLTAIQFNLPSRALMLVHREGIRAPMSLTTLSRYSACNRPPAANLMIGDNNMTTLFDVICAAARKPMATATLFGAMAAATCALSSGALAQTPSPLFPLPPQTVSTVPAKGGSKPLRRRVRAPRIPRQRRAAAIRHPGIQLQ